MSFDQFNLPVVTLNGYLWDTMKQIDPTLTQTKNYGKSKIPFFPMGDSASGTKAWENKTYIIYDRMLRMRPSPFYPIKREHIQYAVKGREGGVFEWGLALQYILDRMDDAAQDINEWNRQQEEPSKVYFHHVKVFQNDFARARDFSVQPFYVAEFIIEIEYHFTDSLEDHL
jgi:hypothetical protein